MDINLNGEATIKANNLKKSALLLQNAYERHHRNNYKDADRFLKLSDQINSDLNNDEVALSAGFTNFRKQQDSNNIIIENTNIGDVSELVIAIGRDGTCKTSTLNTSSSLKNTDVLAVAMMQILGCIRGEEASGYLGNDNNKFFETFDDLINIQLKPKHTDALKELTGRDDIKKITLDEIKGQNINNKFSFFLIYADAYRNYYQDKNTYEAFLLEGDSTISMQPQKKSHYAVMKEMKYFDVFLQEVLNLDENFFFTNGVVIEEDEPSEETIITFHASSADIIEKFYEKKATIEKAITNSIQGNEQADTDIPTQKTLLSNVSNIIKSYLFQSADIESAVFIPKYKGQVNEILTEGENLNNGINFIYLNNGKPINSSKIKKNLCCLIDCDLNLNAVEQQFNFSLDKATRSQNTLRDNSLLYCVDGKRYFSDFVLQQNSWVLEELIDDLLDYWGITPHKKLVMQMLLDANEKGSIAELDGKQIRNIGLNLTALSKYEALTNSVKHGCKALVILAHLFNSNEVIEDEELGIFMDRAINDFDNVCHENDNKLLKQLLISAFNVSELGLNATNYNILLNGQKNLVINPYVDTSELQDLFNNLSSMLPDLTEIKFDDLFKGLSADISKEQDSDNILVFPVHVAEQNAEQNHYFGISKAQEVSDNKDPNLGH